MSYICGGGPSAPTESGEWPDTGTDRICCTGVAMGEAGSCTCWEPIYDLEQQPLDLDQIAMLDSGIQPNTRTSMCGDCAYRPGSPEKAGEPGYKGDADHLEGLAASAERFWCHQGMRLPVAWRHPSGMEIPAHPGGYDPPIRKGIGYQANGQPAELCAGWDARRRALGGEAR